MREFIPFDKSRAIKFGLKDMGHGVTTTVDELREHPHLGDDLLALVRVSEEWARGETTFHVGESGTLLRGMWWLCQMEGIDAEFVREGTLADRQITLDESLLSMDLDALLQVDGGTSQHASMAILFNYCGDGPNTFYPTKFKETIDLLRDYDKGRSGIRLDPTIARHAMACLTGEFYPEHSEDACLAIAMGLMTPEEVKERWPQTVHHESNRPYEMDVATWRIRHGKRKIVTKDHRVIQAMAITHGLSPAWFSNYGYYVSKSWPLFWSFMRYAVGKNGLIEPGDARW